MNTLGQVPSLQILKLRYGSCEEETLNCGTAGSFPRLQVFIMNAVSTKYLTSEEGAMPRLRRAVFYNCHDLKEVTKQMHSLAENRIDRVAPRLPTRTAIGDDKFLTSHTLQEWSGAPANGRNKKEWLILSGATVWCVWKARNDGVFRKEVANRDQGDYNEGDRTQHENMEGGKEKEASGGWRIRLWEQHRGRLKELYKMDTAATQLALIVFPWSYCFVFLL
ncbi:hypothetical protein PIB30_091463 [Stylosanthes scabra]|uniref:Uncharacterized protein n=1 Tax=Stylosanthes scabra TaxID=79078 RepID=A0ABU6YS74_9FABA|nr:hypothetical protein [Stylosanthes scabra]